MSPRTQLSVLAILFVFLGINEAYAQQNAIEADAFATRLDSSKAQVELNFGVVQRALFFSESSSNNWDATISAKAEIWQNGKVVATQVIKKPVHYKMSKASLDSMGANKLLGGAAFTIPYGDHYSAVLIWQGGKTAFDTIAIPLTLPDKDPNHFALSNIEVASSIVKSDGSPNPFEKAGYIVSPNPSAIFGDNYTNLCYYAELYVPKSQIDSSQTVELTSSVVDGTGKEILSSTQKLPLLGSVLPIMAQMDIDGLPGDSYKLILKVKQVGSVVAIAEKPFYFVTDITYQEDKPTAPVVNDDVVFSMSDLSKLTMQEADDKISQLLYVAPETERKTAKSLKTLEEKQRYIFDFWRKQDATISNAQPLTAYHAFMKRVDDATKQYTYQKTPGWKTARGRVSIIYGPPTPNHIYENSFDPAYRPYIIWTYDNNPNIRVTSGSSPEFDFLDKQGSGIYVLVNSTVAGEVSEADWKSREAYRLAH